MALRDWLRVRPQARHIRRALVLFILAPTLLMGGEALLRARLQPLSMEGAATRVFARPPTFARGDRPNRNAVQDHLQRLGYQRARGEEVGIGEYYFGSRGWVIGQRPFRGSGELSPAGFAIVRLDYSGRISRIEDEEGTRVSRVALEPELIGRITHGFREDRLSVELEEIPKHLVDAVFTAEDQRFLEHGGLDYRRIAAAFAANFKAGRVVQGGSTLTQQLAKNLFLSPRRSIVRKLREAMMALTLEGRYSKEEILQAYLNHIYLGQEGAVAIHGVGRAAQHFFGKDVATLSLAESALLVALIRAPSLYSPIRHPETALTRRNLVLRLMRDGGAITGEEYLEASESPLALRKRSPPIRSARYFVDFVSNQLNAEEGTLAEGSPRAVVTTLHAELQRAAEIAVNEGLARLERDFDWLKEGEDGEPLQAALVALDPRSGEILAMVGGRDYGSSQFNRAAYARRQPGSAFKPVVALAALARPDIESGSDSYGSQPRFTLASTLEDRPFKVETPMGPWQPANYDLNFSGTVTLREALERSLNVPFARLGQEVGPERIVDTARELGIDSPLNPFPSLALGASEVTPLELTKAFGVLAAEGFRPELKSLYTDPTEGSQVFSASETYLVTSALLGAVERGTGRGIRTRGFRGDVAAKSGTTNDFRDGWFVGYTPSIVVGVWVGFDHGKRLELPGASVALPIFADFLKAALGPNGRSGPWIGDEFSYPPGLEMVEVDPATGLRGGRGCRGEPELFLRGSAPDRSCRGYRVDDGLRIGDGFRISDRALRDLLEQGGDEVARWLRRILVGEGRN